MDALVHLSRMPALTQLEFALSAILLAADSPLSFSNLHKMRLQSKSLHPISHLLSLIRLPTITDFTARIDDCPSRRELVSLFAGVQTSNTSGTIKHLALNQSSSLRISVFHSEPLLLCFEDLLPCMTLGNLSCLTLDIGWNVGLTETNLLQLASAWSHLEMLFINESFGWNTLSGITP